MYFKASPRMEPTGGGTQMLVHKQLSVPQPAIQGQNPTASTFPTPTNRSHGVCKIPAATPLGFPGLVCWASANPRVGLLCCCSSMPGVSGTCVGVCEARRAPPSLTLLLLREDEAPDELLGQLVARVGDVHGPDVMVQTTNQPFPRKRCCESLLSSQFPWLAGWVAAALPRSPCSPGMGWRQDGSRMAEPGPRTPTPIPSPA